MIVLQKNVNEKKVCSNCGLKEANGNRYNLVLTKNEQKDKFLLSLCLNCLKVLRKNLDICLDSETMIGNINASKRIEVEVNIVEIKERVYFLNNYHTMFTFQTDDGQKYFWHCKSRKEGDFNVGNRILLSMRLTENSSKCEGIEVKNINVKKILR